MARLPVVGQDGNAWGTVLNEFLQVAHNSDGTLSGGGTSPLLSIVTDYGAVGDGTTDNSAAFQAAIDASTGTSGQDTILVPAGRYVINSTLNTGTKRFTMVGLGKPTYNLTTSGAVLMTGTAAMNMFFVDGGGVVENQAGPTFENMCFYDSAAGGTLFSVKNTNRITWRDCFIGSAAASGGGTGIYLTFDASTDCSWHQIDNCHFFRLAMGINAFKGFGGTIMGGDIVGCTVGMDIGPSSQNWRIIGLKGDGGLPFIRCQGSHNEIIGLNWETTDGGSGSYRGVLIDSDGVTSESGNYNMVIGSQFMGAGGSDTRGVEITADSSNNYVGVIDARFMASPGILNNSTTTRVDRLNAGANSWIDFGGVKLFTGANTPEGVITANIGSLFLRTNGSTSTTLYVKTSGTSSTGWTAK